MNAKHISNVVFLLLLVALPLPFATAGAAPLAPLPQEAARAVKKGLIAAEQQEWHLALRYFEDARKTAPLAPEIMFNLGLAESKLPSRELRSLSWFNTYLTAVPDAPNQAAIQEMIGKLEIKTEGGIGKIIGQAKQLAGQFPNESDRISAYIKVGESMARSGDLNGAQQMATAIPPFYTSRLEGIAVSLAKSGDVRGAKDVLSRMDSKVTVYRCSAYAAVAIVQADAGDISGALTTADTCDDDTGYRKHEALIAIAKAMHRARRGEDAGKTFLRARNNTLKSTSKYNAHYIGIAQASVGDVKGSLETAALLEEGTWRSYIYAAIEEKIKELLIDGAPGRNWSIQNLLDAIQPMPEDDRKNRIVSSIYSSEFARLFATGNITEARKIAVKIPPDSGKYYNERSKAFGMLFDHAIRKGDLSVAEVDFDRIIDSELKTKAASLLFRNYLDAGNQKAARSMLFSLKDAVQKSPPALYEIVKLQANTGYLSDALETASMIPVSEEFYKTASLKVIVDKQLENGDIPAAKNTERLMQDGTYKYKQAALKNIVIKLAKSSELDEAKQMASLISVPDTKDSACVEISKQEAAWGEFNPAKKTATLITNDFQRFVVHVDIAARQYDAGYRKEALETLKQAKKFAGTLSDTAQRAEAYSQLAYHYLLYHTEMAGGATEVLALAKSEAQGISDPLKRSDIFLGKYYSLSRAQKTAGAFTDFKESLLSAADAAYLMNGDKRYSYWEFASKAYDLANTGNFTGAMRLADMTEVSKRDHTLERILSVKADAGNIKGALEIFESIPVTSSDRDNAAEKIAVAYLKTGNITAAKAIIANNRKEPGYNLFEAMTRAGELDWAWQAIANRTDDSWLEWFYRYIAVAQAKKGDLAGARTSATHVFDSYHTSAICTAMAEGGAVTEALECAAGVKDADHRRSSSASVARMLIKKGDLAGAGSIVARLISDRMKIADTIEIADLQTQLGNIPDALKTLATIHNKDAEFESWSQYRIAINMDVDAVAKWQPMVEGIKDEYWRSTAYLNRVGSMKDPLAAKKLVATLSDKNLQSKAFLAMARTALLERNFPAATDLAVLIPDADYRMLAFSEIISADNNKQDLTLAMEKIKALPDSAGKTYLLTDGARWLMQAGDSKGAVTLLATAKKSAAAMPDNYWKARVYAEIGELASQLGDRSMSAAMKTLADGVAGRLREDDRRLWTDYQSVAAQTVLPEVKTDPEQRRIGEARRNKVEKWLQLIDGDLSKPMFTDMPGHIQSLTAKTAPWDIFNGLMETADQATKMLEKIKSLAAEN